MVEQSRKARDTHQLSIADGVTSHDKEGKRKRGSTHILLSAAGGTVKDIERKGASVGYLHPVEHRQRYK